jgi:hypothetical protein
MLRQASKHDFEVRLCCAAPEKHFSLTSRPSPFGRFRRTDAPAIVHPVAKTKAEETVRQKAVTPGPHPEEENS